MQLTSISESLRLPFHNGLTRSRRCSHLCRTASEEAFVAVELGSGEGRLAAAILDAFPHAHLVALDGSHRMRETTRGPSKTLRRPI